MTVLIDGNRQVKGRLDSIDDLIAAGQRDVAALSGWRADAFGQDALSLCRGEIALTAKGSEVRVVRL